MGRVKWTQPDEPISVEIIQQIERYFGIEFPEDYKECVKMFNGGYPEPDVFDINEDSDAIFSCLLSFTSDDSNITEVYDISSKLLPKGIYPFARDPFGNLICFDYRKQEKSPMIVFFEHEIEGEDSICYICGTFTELLERLHSVDD